jgi:hypothetical protein
VPVDENAGHSDYYDPGSQTMVAIGELLGNGDGPD